MRISIVSRSRMLATMYQTAPEDKGISVDFIDLRQFNPPDFDDDKIHSSEVYLRFTNCSSSCPSVIALGLYLEVRND